MAASVAPHRLNFATTDPEEAHDWMRTVYVEHTVRLSGNRERFQYRHKGWIGSAFSIAGQRYNMGCTMNSEPLGYLLIATLLGGRVWIAGGREELVPTRGDWFLIDPHTPMNVRWENVQIGLVRVDLTAVERVAAEATGHDSRSTVSFALSRAISDGRVRHWQGLVQYLTHGYLPNEAGCSSPLIHAQTVRLLAATLLETFPNTTMSTDLSRPGTTDPSAVRRAIAFIEERAGEPITLTDIATAARVGPRQLQFAFRRHLETTPMAFLRRERLERAHRSLQAADPANGATVADVATRWGFAHHGRFSADYRRHYGHSPSRTLHS
ncbi:MAG: AraC family transcriptional regulator [Pseudonocardia sp.]